MVKIVFLLLYLFQIALLYFSFWESKLWAQNLIVFYYIMGEVLCAAMFTLVSLCYVVAPDSCKPFMVNISKKRHWAAKYFGIIFYAFVIALFAAQGWFLTASILSLFWAFRILMREVFKTWAKENNWI